MRNEQQQPSPYRESAPVAREGNVFLGNGVIQWVGRTPIVGIADEYMTVSFGQFFQLAGALVGMLADPGEAGQALRAAMAGHRLERVTDGTTPKG